AGLPLSAAQPVDQRPRARHGRGRGRGGERLAHHRPPRGRAGAGRVRRAGAARAGPPGAAPADPAGRHARHRRGGRPRPARARPRGRRRRGRTRGRRHPARRAARAPGARDAPRAGAPRPGLPASRQALPPAGGLSAPNLTPMAKNLVIVESPAKAKTLGKYLGRNYQVKASVGHVMDLPKSKLGVDIDRDFEAEYHVIQGKAKILEEIKSAAKDKENVYLAPDPDREGEAIAWHIARKLGPRRKNVHRVLFNEINKTAVIEEIK